MTPEELRAWMVAVMGSPAAVLVACWALRELRRAVAAIEHAHHEVQGKLNAIGRRLGLSLDDPPRKGAAR